MEVKLVSVTPNAEKQLLYIARVSSNNQDNPDTKLIKYLIANKHWSPLEHVFLTVEVKTSRAISAQIIRHRSLFFQELSTRYKEITEFEPIELRKQATKNRQSSTDIFDPFLDKMDVPASIVIANYLDNTRQLSKKQIIYMNQFYPMYLPHI